MLDRKLVAPTGTCLVRMAATTPGRIRRSASATTTSSSSHDVSASQHSREPVKPRRTKLSHINAVARSGAFQAVTAAETGSAPGPCEGDAGRKPSHSAFPAGPGSSLALLALDLVSV